MNKQLEKKLVYAVILFIAMIGLIYKIKMSSDNNKIERLPKIYLINNSGNTIMSTELYDLPSYVQFIDNREPADKVLLDKIYDCWAKKDMAFIIITNMNVGELAAKYKSDRIYYSTDFERLKKVFRAPPYSTCYLAINRKVVYSGANYQGYERGIKLTLLRELNHQEFSLSKIIAANENIRDIDWLSQLYDQYDSKRSYHIISLFTSICEGCASGQVVRYLNDIYQREKAVDVITILSTDYSDLDRENIKSQLNIRNTVISAAGKLRNKWDDIRESFNDQVVNNIVIVTDNDGKILSYLDPACRDCWTKFFDNLDSSIRKEGRNE